MSVEGFVLLLVFDSLQQVQLFADLVDASGRASQKGNTPECLVSFQPSLQTTEKRQKNPLLQDEIRCLSRAKKKASGSLGAV